MNKLFCLGIVLIEYIAVKSQNQEKLNSLILFYFVVPVCFLILITRVSPKPFISYLASSGEDTLFYTGPLCPAHFQVRNPGTTCMILLENEPQGP